MNRLSTRRLPLRACLKSRMRGHVIVGVMTLAPMSTSSMIQI